MEIEIGNIIKSKIELLPFIDKIAGVVKPISFSTEVSEGKFIKKTFPIACNENVTACEPSTHTDLCPNDQKKSVTYLEGKGIRFIRREGALYFFQGSFDLISWLNIPLLGESQCEISAKAIMSILSAIPQTPQNEGLYQRLLITPLGQNAKSINPFQKYSYDIEVHQLLIYPYDYIVMPLQVDFVVNKKCIDNWVLNPPIACVDYVS